MIIEGVGFLFSGPFVLLGIMAMTIAMLVNRAGASMVFFDVVGRFQAQRLIDDSRASMTLFNAIMLDAFANIQDSINVLGGGFANWVESLLPTVELITDAEIQLRKFVDTAEDFENITDAVHQLSIEFGMTANAAMDAASRMAQLQSVLGEGMTPTGTRLGMEFGLISGMETEAAMTRLVNLNQQIGFMQEGVEELTSQQAKANKIRENTIDVLDKLNTVENRSAATMEQITYVMNQFAAQAHLTGESISAMAAQSAVLIEAGEEQGKAGRALKMFYARLGGDIGGARQELEKQGIATRDSTGALLPLSHILGQLSEDWDTLNSGQKQSIAQTVAGNRHYTRFIKLMENWDRATQLTTEANMRLTPAMDEVNERLQNSITAYRGAEAELARYRAELGQLFLPAMTQAAETQTLFTKALIGMLENEGRVASFAKGLYLIGEDMKNLVAPIMGVMTNVAALGLAISTNMQVTRAMRGEQIATQEAFGNAGVKYDNATKFLQNFNAVSAETQASLERKARLITNVSQAEHDAAKSEAEQAAKTALMRKVDIAAQETRLANARKEINDRQKKIFYLDREVETIERIIKKRKENNLSIEAEKQELNELGLTKDIHNEKIAHWNIIQEEAILLLRGLRHELNLADAEFKESADIMTSYVMTADEKAFRQKEKLNQQVAAQVGAVYKYTGALMAVSSAVMMFTENEKLMSLAIKGNALAIGLMTAAQLASLAVQAGVNEMSKKLIITYFTEAGVQAASTVATDNDTKAELANAVATAGTTTAINAKNAAIATETTLTTASTWASIRGAVSWVRVAGAVGVAATAVWALSKAWKHFNKTTEETAEGFEEVMSDTFDPAVFDKLVRKQEWTSDSIAAAIQENIDAQEALGTVTSNISEQRQLDLQAELTALREIQFYIDASAASQGGTNFMTEEEFNSITKAQENLTEATITHGKTIQELGRWRVYDKTGGELRDARQKEADDTLAIAQKHFDDVTAEFAAALIFMDKYAIETFDEFNKAVIAHGDIWQDILNDVQGFGGAVARDVSQATDAIYEFNNAREEFFWGSQQPNMTGDLVRQVIQKGVENLITTTEVIMTNNFNGMTTDEAANQILNAIERGAGTRGWSLS